VLKKAAGEFERLFSTFERHRFIEVDKTAFLGTTPLLICYDPPYLG
jgi:hypothetical protein